MPRETIQRRSRLPTTLSMCSNAGLKLITQPPTMKLNEVKVLRTRAPRLEDVGHT
jgi:hypothetical protein